MTRFFLIVFGFIVVWTFALKPQYEGVTKIIIEKVESSNLTDRPRDARPDEQFYETQFQLIQSRAVALRVVEMLSLEQNFDVIAPFIGDEATFRVPVKTWIKNLVKQAKGAIGNFAGEDEAGPPLDEEKTLQSKKERIAGMLKGGLTVQPLMDSNITEIRYLSPNPEFSALVANSYAAAYLEETLNMKMEATRRNLEWMTKKSAEEREKLEKREAELQEYMRQNDLVAMENRITLVPQQLAQLGKDLVIAEMKRKELSLLFNKINRVSGNPDAAETILSISEGNTLQILRAQIMQAEQEVMQLSNKYGSKHPSMVKARGDLNILRDKRRQEIRRLTQKVRDQYELASSNENSLREQLESMRSEAMSVNEKFVQYSSLQREIETNQQLFNKLLAKIKDQSITGETQPVNLWIVEESRVPGSQAKPWVAVNLVLGIIIGLAGGVLGAFLIDYMDNTIKSPEDAEAVLGVPVLGVISLSKNSIEGIVAREPTSPVTESYNHLRTSLQLSAADSPPRKILVTSSIQGEGKSTTAINLAFSFAKSESRVLLIDGDMRRPRVSKVFKLKNKEGLSSYLSGATENYLVHKGMHPNLSIITSGPTPPNPSELLSSNRFKMLIKELSTQFDVIVCDSPPILSVTDPRAMSQSFDGILMVARGGVTTFPLVGRGVKHLREVNATLLGLVINGLDPKKHSEYYHDYYYYSSYNTEGPNSPAKSSIVPS